MRLVEGIWVHSVPNAPFESLSTAGDWLAREPELLHVTLHSSPRIDLQIIINMLRQFFYDPEVMLFTLSLSPDVKDI